LALPAAVMTLAIEENLPRALDPRAWFQLVNRIGQPYFLAAGLQFVFNVGAFKAQALALPLVPPAVVLVAAMLLVHAVVLANFHLMGRLVNEFHDELGFEPDAHVVPDIRGSTDPDQGLLDKVATLARGGQAEAACELLARRLRMPDARQAAHAHYHKLLGQA